MSDDVPKAFSGDKDAYLRASEKEAAMESKAVLNAQTSHTDSSAITSRADARQSSGFGMRGVPLNPKPETLNPKP